jgi:hypothetical protein
MKFIAPQDLNLKHEIMIRLEDYKGHMIFMGFLFYSSFCISINIV